MVKRELAPGPNAVRVLSKIGVLDAILERASERELNFGPMVFVPGKEGHEVIYDVSDLVDKERMPT